MIITNGLVSPLISHDDIDAFATAVATPTGAGASVENYERVLRLLFPLKDLGKAYDDTVAIEGKHLDQLKADVDGLVSEMFPQTADKTISDWERVYGITPGPDDSLQYRRSVLLQKVRAIGGLNLSYFISLIAALGFTITIEECKPNLGGYGEESIFLWKVHVVGDQYLYYFNAGDSLAGDLLLDWTGNDVIEDIINDLKPAHTEAQFIYE